MKNLVGGSKNRYVKALIYLRHVFKSKIGGSKWQTKSNLLIVAWPLIANAKGRGLMLVTKLCGNGTWKLI